jgi:hypothetical protein
MGYRIFLSHSSRDSVWVNWIKENARRIAVEVYCYEHDPQPGKVVADKLKAAIGDCDALVVLLTANSRFSAYVQQEIGFAERAGKLIIPLVQPGVGPESLAMLEGREYIPFDYQNPQAALLKLLPYLQRLKQVKENQQVVLLGLGAIIALAWLFGGSK